MFSGNYSDFGKKFTCGSGILQLMDDLGNAFDARREHEIFMLGGGNPAHIPEIQKVFRHQMEKILSRPGEFEKIIGDYDSPQGEQHFIGALAELFREQYGWPISSANIALTNSSQNAFFFLFNLFAGKVNGRHKQILFPLAPEYIGYADLGLSDDFFRAIKPSIEEIDEHSFKYHIDFDALDINDDIGAVCVSRPTNPTGNVLTNDEISKLRRYCRDAAVPLIIDNAYGTPFPNIIFTDATPQWDENTILCMSLSKLGLPGTRTGIVIACPETIKAVSSMNAVFSLAPGSLGVALAMEIVKSGQILELSREIIRPFYERKVHHSVDIFHEVLNGVDYSIHKPEGALFLWIWFRNLEISTGRLYEELKQRGVIVVPGHYFFPGIKEDWAHKHECIRVSYAQQDDIVERGIRIIGETVKEFSS